jgi:microcystin-dependent protein
MSWPANGDAIPNQPILSAAYNVRMADLLADLNRPRPISAGGTGASNAAAARAALGITTDIPAGVVLSYAGATAPSGWLFCYGQAVSRSTYAVLFAAIGSQFGGGDGTTTFNLPAARGRVVAGKDNMGGTSANRLTGSFGGVNGDNLGAVGGAESHLLLVAEMPSHDHAGTTSTTGSHAHVQYGSGSPGVEVAAVYTGSGSTPAPQTSATGTGGAHSHTFNTDDAGGDAPHSNIQPTIVLNQIIKI